MSLGLTKLLGALALRPTAGLVQCRGVHYMPRDKETYRGTTKPFYPPHNARLQVKCPIKNDPAMAATRAAIRDIYGPQEKLRRTGGRDPETGKKKYDIRGGGDDRMLKQVMYNRVPMGHEGIVQHRVLQIQECPVRWADLAVIAGPDLQYIVQPVGLKVGDIVEASRDTLGVMTPGSSYPLHMLPIGYQVHMVESTPGEGGLMCRVAGSWCQITTHSDNGKTLIKLPSGDSQWLDGQCMCTIGAVKLTARATEPLGSYKASRARGIKPRRDKQRPKNWRKRHLAMRQDGKMAKKTVRYFTGKPKAGEEDWTPERYANYRSQFGDRRPEVFIKKLKQGDQATIKYINRRTYEPREGKEFQCSYETRTGQVDKYMWREWR